MRGYDNAWVEMIIMKINSSFDCCTYENCWFPPINNFDNFKLKLPVETKTRELKLMNNYRFENIFRGEPVEFNILSTDSIRSDAYARGRI